jgi:hypothetical protein
VPREVIDPGPFRFKEIHGPHRSLDERRQVTYEAWRANGAPEAPLGGVFAKIDEARRTATPQFTARLNEFQALYARGAAVEPIIAKERDFTLSSGDNAPIVLDGRHRVFAAARAAAARLPCSCCCDRMPFL